MLNRISLMGRLTRDPELRTIPSGASVASFSLAVDRRFTKQGEEKQTDFIDIVVWRERAEFVHKYFRKGQLVAIDGRLQSRNWEDKHGQKRVSIEVVADNVYFAERKSDSPQGGIAHPSAQNSGADQSAPPFDVDAPSTFAVLDDDDGELPF
ncbi:MAG: single-stranded DNA-binding protein [Oscillospiraceae bacterium]|nr:single-stranded DNA-binding protein [Oscillospiraceae bacterium]